MLTFFEAPKVTSFEIYPTKETVTVDPSLASSVHLPSMSVIADFCPALTTAPGRGELSAASTTVPRY